MKKIVLSLLMILTIVYADFTRSNGIVTDNKTGLQWQDDYSDNGGYIKSAKWTDAIVYCESLSLGGYDDWRLPNIIELRSIVDRSLVNPAIDPTFLSVTSYFYWSSTAHTYYAGGVWVVDFSDGNSNDYSKSHTYYVRCVRGGQ